MSSIRRACDRIRGCRATLGKVLANDFDGCRVLRIDATSQSVALAAVDALFAATGKQVRALPFFAQQRQV